MTDKYRIFFLICLLAACLTQFASDIYAPSLISIASDLKTTHDKVQWSMAIYLLGVALSLLVYGPLSEGFGRKIPFVIGLCIMLFGSFLSWTAPTIHALILGRLIQGCGAGAASGLWTSIFRDLFGGSDLAKYSSKIAVFIMLSLSLAPLIGGYLEEYFTWRSTFGFVFFYTLLTLLAVAFGYQETNQYKLRKKWAWNFVFCTYKHLFSHPFFMGIAFCNFLSYGAYFSLFVVSPILLIHKAKMAPLAFGGFLFLGSAIAYILAGIINSYFVVRLGSKMMLRFGWLIMTLSGLCMLLLADSQGITLLSIGVPMFFFFFGSTFIWPNTFTLAMNPFPHIAGYAGVTYRFMLLGGGAVLGALVSYLPENTQEPLAYVMMICSALAWLVYESVRSHSQSV